MLTWKELQEICTNGIECGAHTHTHPSLDTLTHDAARDEIVRSKFVLEDHLGRKILSFAYPYGHYTSAVQAMVQQAGFTSACAVRYTQSSLADNTYALARHIITAKMDVSALAALLARQPRLGMSQVLQVRAHMWSMVRLSAVRVQRLTGTRN
jgi:peptidoglycan/xylan/chitin deacetylase (PgdA/CDA1 family)